jgi:bacillithiol biosynthesis deacetylase BshB1
MKILVFGIHPDDVELGCGGTVALCTRLGHEVTIADLSRGESSSNGTPEERAGEAVEGARILGCGNRLNLEIPDTQVRSGDAGFRGRVATLVRRVKPDLVLLPSGDDPHPDHAEGAVLIEHALYLAGIHGYQGGEEELGPWAVKQGLVYPGRRDLEPGLVVDISETFEQKMDAIRAHKTQFGTGPGYKNTPLNRPDFLSVVEARCRLAGHLIDVRWGEPFKTLNKIGIKDLSIFE